MYWWWAAPGISDFFFFLSFAAEVNSTGKFHFLIIKTKMTSFWISVPHYTCYRFSVRNFLLLWKYSHTSPHSGSGQWQTRVGSAVICEGNVWVSREICIGHTYSSEGVLGDWENNTVNVNKCFVKFLNWVPYLKKKILMPTFTILFAVPWSKREVYDNIAVKTCALSSGGG